VLGLSKKIAISPQMRDELKEFCMKGKTYEDVIKRLLQSAKERQLHDLLMDKKDYLTISETSKRLKAK
jgi:predicted CopG family antitoxin